MLQPLRRHLLALTSLAFLFLDCAGSGTPRAPHLRLDRTTVDFGTLVLLTSSSSVAVSVTVSNVGTGPAGPLSTALVGADPAAFSIVLDSCDGVTLAVNETCTVHLAPTASTVGNFAGSLEVSVDASERATAGLAANIVTPAVLQLTPGDEDLGSVVVGTASSPVIFTVKNLGQSRTGPLQPASLGGSDAASFVVLSDACSGQSLDANDSCLLRVALHPTATTGLRSASLSITATPGGTTVAALHGASVTAATISVAPTTYDFGIRDLYTPGGSQKLTVTNEGSVPSAPLTTSLSGTNSSEFSLGSDTCAGQAIAAGGNCSVTVAFNPLSFGAKAATLDVSGAGGASVALTATGRDEVMLAVSTGGTGHGTLAIGGFDCGTNCYQQVTRTTFAPSIAVTATPDANSVFTGWAGPGAAGCSAAAPTCDIAMTQAQSLTAVFTLKRYTLTVKVTYFGQAASTVTSSPAGINANGAGTFSAVFDAGTAIWLNVYNTASMLPHWTAGTGSPCVGAASTCSFVLNADTTQTLTVSAYNYVFATSQTFSGNLGGLSGADSACQAAAGNAGLPGRYLAYLSTSAINARTRLTATGANGWVRLDGTPFADSLTALFTNFRVYYPPRLNEHGTGNASPVVWTGTNDDGTVSSMTCSDWTAVAPSAGSGGFSTAGSGDWANISGASCSNVYGLYCFGTDLNRGVIISSVAGRRAFVTKGGFNTSLGLAGADALCAAEASAAGLSGAANFQALLATSTATAASRFNLNGTPWVRIDGIPLAATTADLMNGSLLSALTVHADGTTYARAFVNALTGAATPNTQGTSAWTCADWTTAVGFGAYRGVAGFTTAGFFGWSADAPCSTVSYSLYCLER